MIHRIKMIAMMKYWFEFVNNAIAFQLHVGPLAGHYQLVPARNSVRLYQSDSVWAGEARPNACLPAPTNWWPQRVHGL